MAFVIDKEDLGPGLAIFRRGDVGHRNWYCRVKMPKADRYKTVSLKTPNINEARTAAMRKLAEVEIKLEAGVPVFNRPFRQIGLDYIAEQEKRARGGEITVERVKRISSVIKGILDRYVGTTQVHLIGPDTWENYPSWRRAHGEGRMTRPGSLRLRTDDEVERSEKAAAAAEAARKKAVRDKIDPRTFPKVNARAKTKDQPWIIVSDATISFEMSIFAAVMNYATAKRFVPMDHRFDKRPTLKKMRRDEFTLEEYRRLHTKARQWIDKAEEGSASRWYRQMAYNFILIMCNTGMRPSEAKNLRWRDVTVAKDRDGQELFVLFVSGKGKSRKLVAPKSVGEYLERVRKLCEGEPLDAPVHDDAPTLGASKRLDAPVFVTSIGKATTSLYKHIIEDMLEYAGLRTGPSGILRSTYSFRHTYATLRLSEGIDVYFLAEQMGTSVKMIEEHYGHVNTIKHADRVLQGMGSWAPPADPVAVATDATASSAAAVPTRKTGKKARDAKAARASALRQNAIPISKQP